MDFNTNFLFLTHNEYRKIRYTEIGKRFSLCHLYSLCVVNYYLEIFTIVFLFSFLSLSLQEYSLALSLCFDRLLYELNIKKYDVKTFELIDYQNWHFPNGLEADTTILTVSWTSFVYIAYYF